MAFGFLSIAEAVEFAASHWPDHGYTFQNLKGEETKRSFPAMERESAARGSVLQRLGMKKGDRLALVIIDPEDFVSTFFAALRLGVIAVPIYPPMFLGNVEAYQQRTARILDAAGAKAIVVSETLAGVLRALVDRVASLQKIIPVDSLRESTGTVAFSKITPEDVAFLQFTSGSTSDPRGVAVPHRCLLSNALGISGPAGLRVDPRRDLGVTWLPLYHDMGLVGFVIASVCIGISVVFIPTLRFLRNPSVWMDTMHRHRGTISFGPTFSYALATKAATPERLHRWDLSCVKMLGCGGEPVNPSVIRTFTRIFHEHAGLRDDVVRPAYGLAEATLMTSLTPLDHCMKTLRVDAKRFQENGVAEPVRDTRAFLEHVSVGRVIQEHEVIIVAKDGSTLPDRHEGEVVVRGPSVTPGYFNDPEGGADVFRNGMLHTGDLGYLDRGDLYITGRIKDLIIHNGRNIHPQAVEWVAEQVEGVRNGNVVALTIPGQDTEHIVVVLETRGTNHTGIVSRVKTAVQQELSLPVAEVVCLGRGELPKTSSGKVQRHLTRQQYLDSTIRRT